MQRGERESLLRAAMLIRDGLLIAKTAAWTQVQTIQSYLTVIFFYYYFSPFQPPTTCSERIARTHLLVKTVKIEPSGQT